MYMGEGFPLIVHKGKSLREKEESCWLRQTWGHIDSFSYGGSLPESPVVSDLGSGIKGYSEASMEEKSPSSLGFHMAFAYLELLDFARRL